jgi:hypothetical protein
MKWLLLVGLVSIVVGTVGVVAQLPGENAPDDTADDMAEYIETITLDLIDKIWDIPNNEGIIPTFFETVNVGQVIFLLLFVGVIGGVVIGIQRGL